MVCLPNTGKTIWLANRHLKNVRIFHHNITVSSLCMYYSASTLTCCCGNILIYSCNQQLHCNVNSFSRCQSTSLKHGFLSKYNIWTKVGMVIWWGWAEAESSCANIQVCQSLISQTGRTGEDQEWGNTVRQSSDSQLCFHQTLISLAAQSTATCRSVCILIQHSVVPAVSAWHSGSLCCVRSIAKATVRV